MHFLESIIMTTNISIQHFHDTLGKIVEIFDPVQESAVQVTEVALLPDPEQVSSEEFEKLQALAARYNAAVAELSLIQSEFHDVVEGQYC